MVIDQMPQGEGAMKVASCEILLSVVGRRRHGHILYFASASRRIDWQRATCLASAADIVPWSSASLLKYGVASWMVRGSWLLNAKANGGGCESAWRLRRFVEMDGGASRRRQDAVESKARRK